MPRRPWRTTWPFCASAASRLRSLWRSPWKSGTPTSRRRHCRRLESSSGASPTHGFRLSEHRKKHDLYEHLVSKRRVMVPRHWKQELRTGLFQRMLRDAGLK